MPIGFSWGYKARLSEIDTMDFCLLFEHLELLDANEVALICGVNLATAKRWISKNNAPIPARRLLAFYRRGLPATHGFDSMYINHGGLLVNDNGDKFAASDINAMTYTRAQLQQLKTQVKLLRRELDEIRNTKSTASNDAFYLIG